MEKRDSRYELLRIVATIVITLNHIPCSDNALLINQYIKKWFFAGGQFGVNLFVIIGAWFLSASSFKSFRIIRLIIQMVFYSLLLDLVAIVLGSSITVGAILNSFSYWFCFGYVIMLLAAPFLQKIRHKEWIVLFGGAFSFITTVWGYINPSFFLVRLSLKGIFIGPVWFMYIFIVISFIKEKHEEARISPKKWFLIFITSYLVMFMVLAMGGKTYIRELHSPVCFVCALSFFKCIANTSITNSRIINRMAGYTFGAYLLQAHSLFRPYLWEGLFSFTVNSERTIFYGLIGMVSVVVVFLLTIGTEMLRERIMTRKWLDIRIKKKSEKFDKIYTDIVLKITKKWI